MWNICVYVRVFKCSCIQQQQLPLYTTQQIPLSPYRPQRTLSLFWHRQQNKSNNKRWPLSASFLLCVPRMCVCINWCVNVNKLASQQVEPMVPFVRFLCARKIKHIHTFSKKLTCLYMCVLLFMLFIAKATWQNLRKAILVDKENHNKTQYTHTHTHTNANFCEQVLL